MRITAEIFKKCVHDLIDHGVYPGPTAINDYINRNWNPDRTVDNHLNGRDTRLRREIMQERGIPLRRPPV
jgi:hypothetical protein